MKVISGETLNDLRKDLRKKVVGGETLKNIREDLYKR